MNHAFKRTDRIAELMQRTLAQLIQQEVNDPRLPEFITISAVTVTKDLSHANVYFTVLNSDACLVERILNAASRYLRSALARTLTLRTVPQLHFRFDQSVEYGRRLSRLIDDANDAIPDDDTTP